MKRLLTYQRKKLLVLMVCVLIAMVGLTGRLVYLMIIKSEFYGEKADDLHERERSIKAARGRILDRNGVVLASNKSVWLSKTQPGEVYTVPISHGEGRFLADEALIRKLAANGQIATQYVDSTDAPTMDVHFNPNGSAFAVEGITSPDGRILGKMGHSERVGEGLYKNVPGKYDMGLFESAVDYFKI